MTSSIPAASPLPQAGSEWRLQPRYRFRKLLGAGSYGCVCEATVAEQEVSDAAHSIPVHKVAVKRIQRVFEDVRDTKRILRELAILRALGDCSQRVVRLLEVLAPEKPSSFDEVYLVLEHAGQDLRAISRRQWFFLEEFDVRGLLHDLLQGLQVLHATGVLHRDLKPANCIVRERVLPPGADPDVARPSLELKICDFGHARVIISDGRSSLLYHSGQRQYSMQLCPDRQVARRRSMTCHVASRWYRAPELILMQANYTFAVDMWSAGCVAAELFQMMRGNAETIKQRRPLLPGHGCFPLSPGAEAADGFSDVNDQLALILQHVGSPSETDISELAPEAGSAVASAARLYLRSFPQSNATDLRELFPATSEHGRNLLREMLRLAPSKRVTVPEALAHPFLTELSPSLPECCHDSRPLPTLLEPLDFEDEEDLDMSQFRHLVLREIRHWHPDLSEAGVELIGQPMKLEAEALALSAEAGDRCRSISAEPETQMQASPKTIVFSNSSTTASTEPPMSQGGIAEASSSERRIRPEPSDAEILARSVA